MTKLAYIVLTEDGVDQIGEDSRAAKDEAAQIDGQVQEVPWEMQDACVERVDQLHAEEAAHMRGAPSVAKMRRVIRELVAAEATETPAPMGDDQAVMIAGGVEGANEERCLQAWQHLVDTGIAWQLQGFFGRTADALLEAGRIDAPLSGHSGAAAPSDRGRRAEA